MSIDTLLLLILILLVLHLLLLLRQATRPAVAGGVILGPDTQLSNGIRYELMRARDQINNLLGVHHG